MKHISILITLCALVFAQMAHAAQIVGSVTENGIRYSLYDDNTAGLVACFHNLAPVDIVLPSTITYEGKDYTLTTIGNEAFQDFEINHNIENTQSVVCENDLAAHRVIALARIRQALPGGLIEEEQTVLDGKIAKINDANSLAAIYTPQKEALDWMALHQERISALADIEAAKQGITNSTYLNGLVKEQMTAIMNTTDAETITSKKDEAVNALNAAVPVYKAAQDEDKAALPTSGTTGNGVRIIQGENVSELFNPDKVEFFKKE